VSREPQPRSGGLSLQTLLISSLAAVAAAIVVPMFWVRGSLLATAITPIIVAVTSELLNRPAKAITAAAPRVTRRTATGAAVRSRQPSGVGARGDGPEQPPPRGEDPFGLYEPEKPKGRSPLRLAILTGLLAAVIGAGVVTASELALFGHQIGDTKRQTGLLGGKSDATPTATATPSGSATASPEETATPSATESATPEAGATPDPAAPTPQATTPPAPAPPSEATPVPTATP
jgi:hypothetical protein